jgi:hypothetical protein
MSVTSNAEAVTTRFVNFLDRHGVDAELAESLAESIGGAMWERAMAQRDPAGQTWTANAESTIRKKGHDHVGIDSGEMLEKDNFTSDYHYTSRGFNLRYSGPADKLAWFEGDNRYGIERKVWGMDDAIRRVARAAAADHWARRRGR